MNAFYKTQIVAVLALVSCSHVLAASDVERLGKDLTPLGALKAGNANGSIPAWTGGLTMTKDAFDSVKGYKNPYEAEKPLLTITAANAESYKDKISEGQLAMLRRHPNTWKMNVYPTHRSASFPQFVYDAVKVNAEHTKLTEDGNGVSEVKVATPFPVPKSGLEVLWNHLLRYRGNAVQRTNAGANIQAGGSYTLNKNRDIYLYNRDFRNDGSTEGNMLFYYLQETLAPPRDAGVVRLIQDTVNQTVAPRQSWVYTPGQRRVRRSPTVGYDTPTAGGLMTVDDVDMFNGAPDRFTWEILDKKEMYVPYNNYRFASRTNTYKDIIQTAHVNPALTRYELHRVWHVRAKLKPGMRHVYSQRDFYFDEDSYQILVAESRDSRGELWRLAETYIINYYDHQIVWTAGEGQYDLISGRYTINALAQEETPVNFDVKPDLQDFTPARLRQAGVR
ncbi:hypothetical protein VP02_00825 [Pseudomonas ogarae]|uniref:Outer membrane lipoprotein-sorting protein n=1 Tax=Pseudomonas kilonensis TaxID=132476 RepID=A0A0F4XVM1_9PSED|nr:DUF1329 domain-containing protein [Pseudomonas ogarae]KKA09927.1 hypothetical protein VP02_00825 [Pseudomonas ogarae]